MSVFLYKAYINKYTMTFIRHPAINPRCLVSRGRNIMNINITEPFNRTIDDHLHKCQYHSILQYRLVLARIAYVFRLF